jgi:hypothetical protein
VTTITLSPPTLIIARALVLPHPHSHTLLLATPTWWPLPHALTVVRTPSPLPSRSQHRCGDDDATTITPHDHRVIIITTYPHHQTHFTHIPPRPLSHLALALMPPHSQHRCGGCHSPSPSRTLAGPYSSPPMVHPECHPHLRAQHPSPRSILGNYQIRSHPDTFISRMDICFSCFSSAFSLDSISFVCRYMK